MKMNISINISAIELYDSFPLKQLSISATNPVTVTRVFNLAETGVLMQSSRSSQ